MPPDEEGTQKASGLPFVMAEADEPDEGSEPCRFSWPQLVVEALRRPEAR